ncbi:hypothetical protein [Kitasatospora purpeofusca]|uniref:hypothetical protein n=1 Tax=Kitasatospora purpeofusca TaxID=67352 RepID=UPI002A5A6846|nr:hypothetical protein [Kitasatospora purpeofusca]MDY0815753.1 hypothetical protein [Kitasatospora purpeofusca]
MSADETPWDDAVGRGLAFLHRALGPTGLPSARPGADPELRRPLSGAEGRRHLLVTHGEDLGFDPDDEGFSAMWGLALLRPDSGRAEERELVAVLAPQVARYREPAAQRYRTFPPGLPFPAGTDSTAVAAGGLARHGLLGPAELDDIARELLDTQIGPDDGPIPAYWEDSDRSPARGRRYDAVVAANILFALHLPGAVGRLPHPAAEATLRYVVEHLNGPRTGTRYYAAPEAFLHAAARAATVVPELAAPVRRAVGHVTTQTADTPLAVALLVLAGEYAGESAELPELRRRLAGAQLADGSWPAAGYFRTGRLPLYFGSPHLTTLFAVRALRPEAAGRP